MPRIEMDGCRFMPLPRGLRDAADLPRLTELLWRRGWREPRLAKLLEARQQLRDLLAKLDGNDELDSLLENIVQNTEDLKKVAEQLQHRRAA